MSRSATPCPCGSTYRRTTAGEAEDGQDLEWLSCARDVKIVERRGTAIPVELRVEAAVNKSQRIGSYAWETRKESCTTRQCELHGQAVVVSGGVAGDRGVLGSARLEPTDQDTGVPLLLWPAENERAARLQAAELPFLLLVSENEPPPVSAYRFMDWVRCPADPEELVVRQLNLEERFVLSHHGPRPHLEVDTGRLSFLHATTDLTPSHVALVTQLLTVYREILPRAEVRAALCVAPGDDELLASRLVRVRRHVRAVGLDIKRVGRVGYALEPIRPD